jgi:hypothetical protein
MSALLTLWQGDPIMEGKKKPRNRQERFYCAYTDFSAVRRRVNQGKRKAGKIGEHGKHV